MSRADATSPEEPTRLGLSRMTTETITWKGRLGPMDLVVGPATFRPSTVSGLLAEALTLNKGDVVVDAGCGSGVLSIIAAKLGAGRVYGVDAADGTVDIANANAERHGVSDVIEFFEGDLFNPLPRDIQADVIIGDVSGVPDDIARASGWFPSGLAGGPSGAELPLRMLDEAKRLLRAGGRLFLPTGSLQDENSILDRAKSAFSSMRQLTEKTIPLPSNLSEDPAILRLLREKVIDLTQRGSRFLWTARIWELS